MHDEDPVTRSEDELRELADRLRLEPGEVLQLVDPRPFKGPWTYMLLDLNFERRRAQLLLLGGQPANNLRLQEGTVCAEALEDLLDDLSSPTEGIHWRRL